MDYWERWVARLLAGGILASSVAFHIEEGVVEERPHINVEPHSDITPGRYTASMVSGTSASSDTGDHVDWNPGLWVP